HDVTTGDDDSCAAGVGCGFGTSPDCDPGYLCQGATGYDGPTGPGTPKGVAAFKAGPHAAVTGTVADAKTHAPVAGARGTIGDVTVTTDGNGYYHAGLAPGRYDVTVAAYGYQQATDGLRLPDGNPVKHDVRLTALPSQTITGTVSDSSGHGWGLYAKL